MPRQHESSSCSDGTWARPAHEHGCSHGADGARGAGDEGRNAPRASYTSQDQHRLDVAILSPQPQVHLRHRLAHRRQKEKETHTRKTFTSLSRTGWEAEASNATFPPTNHPVRSGRHRSRTTRGRIAELARAPGTHAEGRGNVRSATSMSSVLGRGCAYVSGTMQCPGK